MGKKVVLAYSGGLDTSVILKWLVNKGYEVICFVADVGQKEDFAAVKAKAMAVGAKKVYVEDLKEEFVTDYIFQALKSNALYEGKYLLGTAMARPLIAKAQVAIARKENCTCLAHGATGKGNDQVRFELAFMTLMPEVEIISPWKDPSFLAEFQGRPQMIAFAQKFGIPITSTLKKPYSVDENLMHTSYEAGILEDPGLAPSQEIFQHTVSPKDAPDVETMIEITFQGGVPIAVHNLSNGKTVISPLPLFQYLNDLGAANGIGRVDLVENRVVGMKSRGVYETPAGTILWKAHCDLEGLVLDKEVTHLKDILMPKIAELIYGGLWFSPEMEFLMAAVNHSQKDVEGKVTLCLYKGNASVMARTSPKSLYSQDIASMDKLGGYDQTDAKGFIKIQALRLKLGKGVA